MDWVGHSEESSLRTWLEEAAKGRYANDRRLDPFATSMRDLDDVTPHLQSLRSGSPPATNDPRQRITDLRNAGLVDVGSDALSELGEAVLDGWERFDVDSASIDDELSRLLILVFEGRRTGDASYSGYLQYWDDLRNHFSPFELIDNWDALYALNYLDYWREGFAPGDRYRAEGIAVSEIEFDLDDFAASGTASPEAEEGAERIARAIAGKVPRGRHRATFCEALEIVASNGASLEDCLRSYGIPRRPRSWKTLDASRQDKVREIVKHYGVLVPATVTTAVATEELVVAEEDLVAEVEVVEESVAGEADAVESVEKEPKPIELSLPEEIDFEQVEVAAPRPKPVQRSSNGERGGARKINYRAKQDSNDAVGQIGEEFALRYENWRLRNNEELRSAIDHVSKRDDTAGYDIRSYEPDGSNRYLEVKSTLGAAETQFFLSDAELKKAEELGSSYVILRVFNLSGDPKCIEIRYPFDEVIDLRASTYTATFKPEA